MRTANNWKLYRNNQEIKSKAKAEPITITLNNFIKIGSTFEPEKFGIKLPPENIGNRFVFFTFDGYISFSLNFVFYQCFNEWHFYRVFNNYVFENEKGEVFLPKHFYIKTPSIMQIEINSNEDAKKIFMDCEEKIKLE